jgi:hypothetical protein
MEERAAGQLTLDDLDFRMTTYVDNDEWYRVVLPELRRLGVRGLLGLDWDERTESARPPLSEGVAPQESSGPPARPRRRSI